MAPKFGLDDGSSSNFDATLVLATMLTSQLHEGNPSQAPPADDVMIGQADHGMGSQAQQGIPRANVSGHPSDHTKIWSDLSGNYLLIVSMMTIYHALKVTNYCHFNQEVQPKVAVVLKACMFRTKEIQVLLSKGKFKGLVQYKFQRQDLLGEMCLVALIRILNFLICMSMLSAQFFFLNASWSPCCLLMAAAILFCFYIFSHFGVISYANATN